MMNLMQKGFTPILVLVGILIIMGVAGGAYYFGKLPIKPADNNPKACTQEAKQCSDGSFVGRTGPNCEFKPCPSVAPKTPDASPAPTGSAETANWKTFSSTGIAPGTGVTFQYPQDWNIKPMYTFGSTTAIDFQQNETITTVLTFSLIANHNNDTGKPYASLNEYLKISEKDKNAKDLFVGGYKAKMVTNAGGSLMTPFEQAVVFTLDRSSIVSFFYLGKGAYLKPSLAPALEQILATVKFTN